MLLQASALSPAGDTSETRIVASTSITTQYESDFQRASIELMPVHPNVR
jgi:hypothetical protein